MSRLTDRIGELRNSSGIPRIRLPHGIFALMMAVIFVLSALIGALWRGILILLSIALCFVLCFWVYLTYSVWRRYYAVTMFVILGVALTAAGILLGRVITALI